MNEPVYHSTSSPDEAVSNVLQNGPELQPGGHARWSLQKARDSIGLDTLTVLKMLKGGLPPTIVVAMYQSSAISDITSTVGFISAIMAVASQCLTPRAKFMKIMAYNLLSTCTSAALCCLALFSAVKAREHNTPPGGSLDDYNSSACAVSAVWLLFMIWISNALRSYKQSELQDPMVAFAIFASISLTQAPQEPTVASGLSFIRQLLLAFIFGFAIATGVSILILPITNRRNFFMGALKYTATIETILGAQRAYLGDRHHYLSPSAPYTQATEANGLHQRPERHPGGVESIDVSSTVNTLKSNMISLIGTHDKLHGDLIYARNEIAWGKLTASDLQSIFALLRSVMLPLAGLSMLPDIFRSLDEEWKACRKDVDNPQPTTENEWKRFSQPLTEGLDISSQLMNAGLQHALNSLGITSTKTPTQWFASFRSSSVVDVEAADNVSRSGGGRFASHFEEEVNKFFKTQKEVCVFMAASAKVASRQDREQTPVANISEESEDFFVFLFIQYLFRGLLQATLELVKFADSKVTDGTMDQDRLIFPQGRVFKTWFAFRAAEESDTESVGGRDSTTDSTGPNDPEHMPPINSWERGGNALRRISRLLASDQSVFGFRAACASFSVAILAFLHQTQEFFEKQRLIWALIVIAFGMSPTSGAGLFSFAGRIIATIASLVLSLVAWYIVDGHVAGVIVFLYLANVLEYYFYVKYPQLLGPCTISIVTLNVIVGYELQVDKLGVVEAESRGQPYYPIYLFGPYKLLAVIAGCTIAFIWTIFPYPITSRSQVRKLLGRGLFVLANFYSCMHTTIEVWIEGAQNDTETSLSLLEGARRKLFSEEMTLLTAMRIFSSFTVYEPPIGGKFPKSTYDSIISEIQSIVISMALMAKIPKGLDHLSSQQEQKWLRHLASVIESTDFNSHIVTSLLCHLSAAVSNGSALPPYLAPPEPFPIARKLRKLNDGLLDRSNAEDPAFAAFASLEVLSSMMNKNLAKLISDVKSLVGEVKFNGYVQRRPRKNIKIQDNQDKTE